MVSTPGGRRSLISPLAFAGGGAATPAQPDPVTTKLLNQNSLQLGLVATQITQLNRDVASLNTSLQAISTGLATTQALERQKEQQEQAQEARLAQQQLREGKESVIEKKIEAAAIAPAQKIANKASFTLGKLGNFFLLLIGGWLADNVIDALKARSEGNTKKLNEIKLETLTGLGVIVGVFVASRGALGLLSGSFRRVAVLLAAVAAAGLFTKPGRDFIGVITEAAKEFYNEQIKKIPFIGPLLPNVPPPNPNANQPPGQNPPGQNPPGQNPPPTINPNRPPGLNKGGLVKGTPGIDQIPAMLTDGEFVIPNNVVSDFGVDFLESIRVGQSLFATNAPDISSPAAEVQPMESMSGEKLDPAEKAGHKETPDVKLEPTPASDDSRTEPADVPLAGDPSRGLEPGQINPGDKTLSEIGFSVSEVQQYINEENYIGKTGTLPSNITPILKAQKVAEKVSEPPPEQPINVVPIPIPPPPSQAPAQAAPPAISGTIGNVPLYATSDSSNMYRLTAVSAFNVPSA
tara:strand:+ start:948 stop:2504 length:1557 start_codon:yes stop_codon:yes gene_type:complete